MTTDLQQLPQVIQTCEQVAQAMIDTGQKWGPDSGFLAMLCPTDDARARYSVEQCCSAVLSRLKRIRRDTLSPDAIRTCSLVLQMKECCQHCPEANRVNIKDARQFACLIRQRFPKRAGSGFRFKLNEKGQIIEQP